MFISCSSLLTCCRSFPCAFVFTDLLLIFYYWKAIGDKFFVVHHLAALYAYYYVLVSALLSNSRTCRQDGKETTKGEQLGLSPHLAPHSVSVTAPHAALKRCGGNFYMKVQYV